MEQGNSEAKFAESAITAGAREVISKPFSISDLMVRLQRMLHIQEPALEQRV